MTKTFFNDAIIGNSRMLGCLSEKGELTRLFWPNIDYIQHIDQMLAGIFIADENSKTLWLSSDTFEHSQAYIKGTNIIETICSSSAYNIRISQLDFCLIHRDALIRKYEIYNNSDEEVELDFILFSSNITTTSNLAGTRFEFEEDALIHHKHGYYMSICGDREVSQFQVGHNAYAGAELNELKGFDYTLMVNDGVLSFKLGKFKPKEKKTFSIKVCFSNNFRELKEITQEIKKIKSWELLEKTKGYWHDFIRNSRSLVTGKKEIDDLYEQSLLIFKLMADERSGGLLAAPEADEERQKCGRYAYCWGRDAAFIASALDKCGLTETVDKFYEWAVNVQDDNGGWQQRYHMDGNLAPSWGIQIDETGALIWGMYKHYEVTKNHEFLIKVWDSVQRGVEFLINFIDNETGLTKPCFDLWEEYVGEFAYSAAAVYAGITAGVRICNMLGKPKEIATSWEASAESILKSIGSKLWDDERKSFLRGVKTKLNPAGVEPSINTTSIMVNSKGYSWEVSLEDKTVDVSLIGLSVPFGLFEVEDSRMIETVTSIEKYLTSPVVGGIIRHEDDQYIGGNPWILTTLWVALYYLKKKNMPKVLEYFNWALKGRTKLNLLPEQISKTDGKPAWIIPLTWSHAMFVLVLDGLVEAKAI
jgi:glucoamylase